MKRVTGTATALIALGAWVQSAWPAIAVTFGQASIRQSSMIAVAVPRSSGYYSLLILEQISSEKPCWRESGSSPTRVEPLLVNFNFTNICGRSTDSNGYSLRIADKDIGMDYRLSLQKRGGDLALVGLPRSSSAPMIEIGRTRGIQPGFLKIVLGPGWQFAKRTYSGKILGHVYFSRATATYIAQNTAQATRKPVARPRLSQPIASTKRPLTPNPLSSSGDSPGALSRRPDTIASSRPVRSQLPSPQRSATAPMIYRVGVVAPSPAQQAKIRSKMPGAFRTSDRDKTVLQVGLFTNALKASSLQSELQQQGYVVLVRSTAAAPSSLSSSSEFGSKSRSGTPVNAPLRSALSVPGENVPIGRTQGAKGIYVSQIPGSQARILPPPPPQNSTAFQLRVVVPAESQSQQTRIRTLVPTAFRSRYNNQHVMQVGSFAHAEEAKPVIDLLEKNGFKPIQDRP